MNKARRMRRVNHSVSEGEKRNENESLVGKPEGVQQCEDLGVYEEWVWTGFSWPKIGTSGAVWEQRQ
jgi:hypothetical protein